MTSRRFRFYGDNERDAVKTALSHCVQKWADSYANGTGFASSLSDPVESLVSPARKWSIVSDGTHCIAYSISAGFSRQLAFAAGWCDTELARKPSKIWELTVDDCVETLARSMLQNFTEGAVLNTAEVPEPTQRIEPDNAWLQRASGYLWGSMPLGRESLDLVIDPASIEALLTSTQVAGAKGGLTGRRNAIADKECQIHAVSGSVEITIGELNGLSPGHVIKLDQRIDEAFDIVVENGRVIAKAYLANCGSNKAVQLVKL